MAAATASDVDLTINHAHAVFMSGTWSRATPLHRSQVLTKLARELESRVPEFAEIEMRQTGRAIREMRAQLGRLGEWLSVRPLSRPRSEEND